MKGKSLNRRKFAKILGAAGTALAVQPLSGLTSDSVQTQSKPSTNIAVAGKTLRKNGSMPGIFPGKVIHVKNPDAVVNDEPVEAVAYLMLHKAMLELTGQKRIEQAWRMFVRPGTDRTVQLHLGLERL